jgi:outer membrane protein assembly factor BamB
MKTAVAGIVSFGATLLVGAAAVMLWLSGGMAYDVSMREPGSRPVGATGQDVPDKVEGQTETFDVPPAKIRGDWPGYRGATRENISDDMTELARTWPEGGPPVLWSLEVGEGYAGCAVMGGRVYLHDYDAKKRREVVRCMSLADGRDIWRYSYKFFVKRWHGYSRTVPAVTEEHLVAFGAKCHVTCLDANSGQFRWDISLVKDYGTKIPQWYAGQCPLIDDANVILAPCGNVTEGEDANGQPVTRGKSVLMTAVNVETGKVVWEAPNPDGWEMTHSSIAMLELEDYTKMYVYCASGGVVAVSAKDGQVLWTLPDWQVDFANVPMPVPIEGDRLFLSGGYGAGCMMLQIVKEGDRYVPQVLWARPQSVFGSSPQTPIYYKSHIFGTRTGGQFVCLSARGEVVWASGAANKFGKDGGAYLIADDLIFALDDEGAMTVMEATPQAYRPLAKARVLPGLHSWAPMALVSGRLLARDETLLRCFDVSKQKP